MGHSTSIRRSCCRAPGNGSRFWTRGGWGQGDAIELVALPILRQAFWTTSSTLDGFPMRSRCLTAVEATTPDRSRPLIVRASSGSSRDAAGGPEALKSKRPASVRLTWLSFAPCGPLVRGRRAPQRDIHLMAAMFDLTELTGVHAVQTRTATVGIWQALAS